MMRLVCAVLTAPRPTSLLRQTLDSLDAADYSYPVIFDGTPPRFARPSPAGCTAANLAMYRDALARLADTPGVEGLLAFEDDVIVCQGLASYLAQSPWPEDPAKIAIVSPYCPEAYSNYGTPMPKWHREDGRSTLAGSQAWIYPRHFLEKLVEFIQPDEPLGIDVVVGQCALKHDLHIWYHVPSLVQHMGICNSSVGYTEDLGTIYHAATFPGEDFDARSLL
jgi:hypothetical protein